MDDARARAAAFLEGSRVIQVVPGQRVRVSLRYAAATAGILVILAAAKVGESGSSKSRERLATVRARPDSVQSYEPSATDTAIRGVADRIWQTDRYRSEMMQSFFVWLVCACGGIAWQNSMCEPEGRGRSGTETGTDVESGEGAYGSLK